MAFQLVALSGKHKGAAWPIDEAGLVLGRGADCDILLGDHTVSRRHCQFVRNNGEVHFTDLGSRNPALVNGCPKAESVLRVGDEVAVGRELFLLIDADGGARLDVLKRAASDTGSWGDDRRATRAADGEPQRRPRTVQDLALLHEAAEEFACCTSTEALVAALRVRLNERFDPWALWIARANGEEALSFFESETPAPVQRGAAPLEEMQRAMCERQGLRVPSAQRKEDQNLGAFTLVAPISFSDINLGVVAVRGGTGGGAYGQGDLTLLVLLGQSVAPFLYALEDLEQLQRDNARLRARSGESLTLVGKSKAIRRVRTQIAEAAKSDLNVLVLGATGTGKELASRMVHAKSPRHAKPFIIVNCAAIPRDLFESELFGYEKGAFTGAQTASPGLLAQAHGGTLFLDEVGDLSTDNQARILRVIEYGTFRRIGADEESKVDIRIVAATNKDLPVAIKEGSFREDLYHRLNEFQIPIPALRKRPSDIPILAAHFFECGKDQAKRPLLGIAPDALGHLSSCPWPGNVRELRSCIQRGISVAQQERVELRDLLGPGALSAPDASGEKPLSLHEMEKSHISDVLHRCKGDVRRAAKLLEIGRSTIYRKIAEYGIDA